MSNEWDPSIGADIYQLSNPPVLQCVCVRASLDVFKQTSMDDLREKSENLTGMLYCVYICKSCSILIYSAKLSCSKVKLVILTWHVPSFCTLFCCCFFDFDNSKS